MSHCAHCPMAADARCHGEAAPRLCELVDPAHPDHRPGYEASIVEASRAQYPSLTEQAGNLAASLWDWAVDGFKVASPELQAQRRATCAACTRWVAADRRCILCGCYTEAKITITAESCPEGRW